MACNTTPDMANKLDQSNNKVFILYGYWNTPDFDGAAIIKVASTLPPVQKALDDIVDTKAEEFIKINKPRIEIRHENRYEIANNTKYARFFIAEEIIEEECK